ncbi:MAG: hypothetical protein AAGC74_02230 [Verrucomicrobiota bacterium]
MNLKQTIAVGMVVSAGVLAVEGHQSQVSHKGRANSVRVVNHAEKSHLPETKVTKNFVGKTVERMAKASPALKSRGFGRAGR